MALCIGFLSALPIAQAAQPITVTMTADNWRRTRSSSGSWVFDYGLKRLNSGDAVLKGITFSDGTIKFDVNTIGRGVPGIAFRQQDEGNLQLFYLNPDPSCPALQACIHYDPRLMGS